LQARNQIISAPTSHTHAFWHQCPGCCACTSHHHACREEDATDLKSRHKGKLHTEALLQERGTNYTSVRPVYIYGPLNYNPVEEFFFHRLVLNRPICVPNSGQQVTQLGHVKDLADAFTVMLGNPAASKQIFNISGAIT
jgi:nucleoside-diphosphate-sugar epimerase